MRKIFKSTANIFKTSSFFFKLFLRYFWTFRLFSLFFILSPKILRTERNHSLHVYPCFICVVLKPVVLKPVVTSSTLRVSLLFFFPLPLSTRGLHTLGVREQRFASKSTATFITFVVQLKARTCPLSPYC